MRKSDLLSLIHEFDKVYGEGTPIIVGSQSLHAVTDLLPEIARKSIEYDFLLSPGTFEKRALIDEKLGLASEFRIQNGFYADALGLATVVLPDGWNERLTPLLDGEGKVVAHCLEVNDVAACKLVAGREKDFIFLESLLFTDFFSITEFLERLWHVKSKVENDILSNRLEKFSKQLSKWPSEHKESIEKIKLFLLDF